MLQREAGRRTRHNRLRKRLVGMPDRPRLNVFRSHKHVYVQVIDDVANKTLLGCSTKALLKQGQLPRGGNVGAAEQLGRVVAEQALKLGIKQVVFDRGGYKYHGRVKALADSARKTGLEF